MNAYAKRFLVSFIAGAGSALGAAVTKTCWRFAQDKLKQNESKEEAENSKLVVLQPGEES